jgi:hypothetical protein
MTAHLRAKQYAKVNGNTLLHQSLQVLPDHLYNCFISHWYTSCALRK